MSLFPQVGAGSVAQYPVTRSRRWRAMVNQLEDGELIMLPDTTAGQIQWKLFYRDLVAAEIQNLSDLFIASQGGFAPFTFIDPMANLLGWSESPTQSSWQLGLLQTTAGVTDPLGTGRASSITNPSTGMQSLQQSLGVPGEYVACFSVWLRSSVPSTVIVQRDGTALTIAVGTAWKRAFVNGTGVGGALQSTFSIALAAGQTIDVWGLQVEVQPYPSAYKQTVVALGIYPETYFANDELTITSTSVGLSACAINLVSRV